MGAVSLFGLRRLWADCGSVKKFEGREEKGERRVARKRATLKAFGLTPNGQE
jgi:hypothetical protein